MVVKKNKYIGSKDWEEGMLVSWVSDELRISLEEHCPFLGFGKCSEEHPEVCPKVLPTRAQGQRG